MATLLKRIMVQCTGRSILMFSLVIMTLLVYSLTRIYMSKTPSSRKLAESSYRTSKRGPTSQQQQAKVTIGDQHPPKKEQLVQDSAGKKPNQMAERANEKESIEKEKLRKVETSDKQPEETKSEEKKPEEKKPEEKKPEEKKPEEEKPEEKKPEEKKPEEKKPEEKKPEEKKPEEKKPEEKKPEENKQSEPTKYDPKSLEDVKMKEQKVVQIDKTVEGQGNQVSPQPKKEVRNDEERKSGTLEKEEKQPEAKDGEKREVKQVQEQSSPDEKHIELDPDAIETNVPLEPNEAHKLVSQIQKTGNLLLDEFLSHQTPTAVPQMEKWVHLDLKGAAPSLEYLIQLVPLLKRSGATGLLIEYEDMFPYSAELEVIRARRAYSAESLRGFLQVVKNSGMEAVPLVQTFGHMEFVLKHTSFQHLREDQRYPAFLNPAKSEALALVQKMVSQVMSLHADSKYVHLGCDEVKVIGFSGESVAKMSLENYGKAELYMDHVRMLAKFVNDSFPGVKTLIWDDILRQIPVEALMRFRLGTYVEPVIWDYTKNVNIEITKEIWDSYAQVFSNVWVASAFKGASGSVQHLPDLSRHLQNHASWLKVIGDLRISHPNMNVKGFVLTGWSRYEHFSALCELLPASLPSLVACLQIIGNGTWNAEVIQRVSNLLRCSGPIFALNPETLRFEYAFRVPTIDELAEEKSKKQCHFPGDRIFYLILFYHHSVESFEKNFDPITGRTRGQCNRFSLGHSFADPFAIEKVCLRAAEKVSQAFLLIEKRIPAAFRSIYPDGVAREWLDEHVISFETWLEQYYNNLKTLASKPQVWGQRPENAVDRSLVDKGQQQLPNA